MDSTATPNAPTAPTIDPPAAAWPAMTAVRARGHEAFAPRSIAPYGLPGEEVQALNKAHWPVNPSDSVLLIHDVQNHWVGMFADPMPWLERIVRLRQACDASGVPCIYTRARRARNAAERGLALSLWGLGVSAGDSAAGSAEVSLPLAPRAADFVIDKPKYSAFFDTELEDLMRRLGRRQIMLAGVFGHHGIQVTAVDAYMRNLQVLLVADAMADYTPQEHASTLRYVAEVCGCVVTTATLLRELQGGTCA